MLRGFATPQQDRTEPMFEIRDRLAYGRQRQLEALRGATEAPSLYDGVKTAYFVAFDLQELGSRDQRVQGSRKP